jgi:4-oxalocrotonate tautomerase
MPIITLKMARGRSVEQKRQFVETVTRAAVDILQIKPEWVTVLIEEYERENWATGGELHSEKFGPSPAKV